MASKIVTYEQVKDFVQDPQVLIIDVREANEIASSGSIDNSINIPLGDVEEVLKSMPPETFKLKFGRDKPTEDTQIVFSCRLGGRAGKAMDAAADLGYKNVTFYKGSWTEWESKLDQQD